MTTDTHAPAAGGDKKDDKKPAEAKKEAKKKTFGETLVTILLAVLFFAIFLLVLDPLLGIAFGAGSSVITTSARGVMGLARAMEGFDDSLSDFMGAFFALVIRFLIILAGAIASAVLATYIISWLKKPAPAAGAHP